MRIVVIIPTYNEAESVGSLIDAVEIELNEIKNHEFKILVVDANSPDKTGELVKNLQKKYKNLELLVEPTRRGLGAAYILGMLHATNHLSADALMEFDGDFQHNPKEIKKLISALDDGYDYVIGSRYVKGGEIPSQWSWHRKVLSKYGSLIIKSVLRLSIMDNTSGFKLSRVRNFAEKLPLEERVILSRLHAYKIHLLYEMIKLGAKTVEVPIKFLERKRGSSKNTFRDILESLKVILILKFRSLF